MIELYSNGKLLHYDSLIFNGGEPHIKLHETSYPDGCTIIARIQSCNDLIELVSVVDALHRLETRDIDLLIPYFPGARQDRVSNKGEALTVKIYADIINSLKVNTVGICDPHSDVTPALINNCYLYPIEQIIDKTIKQCNPDIIISPDAGASKRIYGYLSTIKCDLPVVQCLKKRDTRTGKLSGFEIASDLDLKSKDVLIIDDIIDGGGTFLGLGDVLDKENVGFMYLYGTHGIFSQGYSNLLQTYDQIYTTNSFTPLIELTENEEEKITVWNLYGV